MIRGRAGTASDESDSGEIGPSSTVSAVPASKRPGDEFSSSSTLDQYPDVGWKSIAHQMTHFPMMSGCPICQRASKKRKQHRSRPEDGHTDVKKFGDAVTMEFISSYSERIPGLTELRGDDEALVKKMS